MIMGVYAKRSHEIIETKTCYIQNKLGEEIAKDVFEFMVENKIEAYNEKTLKGFVRHIVIRVGVKTEEVMVTIVVNNKNLPKEKELVRFLTEQYSQIKTIVKNINNKDTNVILGRTNQVLYGEGYIYDILGEYKFKISPLSFYQVNPIQTEILYNTAIKYAELTGKETVLDLYCGIGTIGIFAAKYAKKVYGIEVIEDAIKDAKENSKLNNIQNTEFMCGEVENILPTINNVKADVIFIDPPRKGCDSKTISTLLEISPKKIVYVSCNPATLARDIALLQEKYELKEVQPVDMFPYTSHVECVALLTRTND